LEIFEIFLTVFSLLYFCFRDALTAVFFMNQAVVQNCWYSVADRIRSDPDLSGLIRIRILALKSDQFLLLFFLEHISAKKFLEEMGTKIYEGKDPNPGVFKVGSDPDLVKYRPDPQH
jgi:hypothetical protein